MVSITLQGLLTIAPTTPATWEHLMPKKLRAVEVITDKLWITYDDSGAKTGTLQLANDDPGWMIQYFADGTKLAWDSDHAEEAFAFEKKTVSSWHQQHVFGYPVPLDLETFKLQEKDGLPCFTKTPASKVFFSAGYYGIKFENGGWLSSFCPKIATLRKYPFIGPFKTEIDVNIAIQRKKRAAEDNT